MESDSQSASTVNPSSNRLADFVGTLIAFLTLILPLTVIFHYSSNPEFSQSTGYALSKSR